MKRVQLFEFEDFDWFPSKIRTGMTHVLVVFLRLMGTAKVLAILLQKAKSKLSFKQIVDLGSGSGGVMPEAVKVMNESEDEQTKLILSDLHPNQEFIKHFNGLSDEGMRYYTESLDATDLNNSPGGIKTMINSFHHMPEDNARAILKSAVENNESILIYEISQNKIPLLIWALFLPLSIPLLILSVFLMTPFVKPLSWHQILFTYIIPIIPICYAWDGQASLPRIYSFGDIKNMINDLSDDSYQWTIEAAEKANGKKSGYFVLGHPAEQTK